MFPYHPSRFGRRHLLACCVAASACPARAAPLIDARKRPVAFHDLSRIVCIGGAVTEIVYALGQDARIVAVDSTSQFPPEALRDKRNVGYMRALSPEGVLSVSPTLLLVLDGSGPPEALDVLSASAVPLLFVDGTPSRASVPARVRFIAAALDVAPRGEALCARIGNDFGRLDQWRAAHRGGQRVLFVLAAQSGRMTAAGAGTAADAIIAMAGAVNVAAGLHGFQPIGDEALPGLAPDIVLAMDHAGPPLAWADMDGPGLRATPAGRRQALLRLDGDFLLGFGPRTPLAALDLAQHLAAAVPA